MKGGINVKTFLEEQLAHEPTKEWLDIIGKYAKLSRYKWALNIGTASGLSAWAIATNGTGKVITVDIKTSSMPMALAYEYDYEDRLIDMNMSSKRYMEGNEVDFDLIIIDGSHEYEDVLSDLENSWKWITDDGYIVCDDYANPRFGPGIKRAISAFVDGKDVRTKVESGKMIIYKPR